MFDDEDELVHFLEHVYEEYDGRGFELTNVPVPASVRIQPWLLEQTRGQFGMHPLSERDLAAAKAHSRNGRALDPASLESLRVPRALQSKETT